MRFKIGDKVKLNLAKEGLLDDCLTILQNFVVDTSISWDNFYATLKAIQCEEEFTVVDITVSGYWLQIGEHRLCFSVTDDDLIQDLI
jgi:hypothetical protein